MEKKGEIVQDVLKNVWLEIEFGKVKVVIYNVLFLVEVFKVYEIFEFGFYFGKVLLFVGNV